MVRTFRANPDKGIVYRDYKGTAYTWDEIATEIERGSEFGKSLVAIGGFVIEAYKSECPPT